MKGQGLLPTREQERASAGARGSATTSPGPGWTRTTRELATENSFPLPSYKIAPDFLKTDDWPWTGLIGGVLNSKITKIFRRPENQIYYH